MAPTEKCDVYSFGVLTLEVIMGKHPGEFISTLQFPMADIQNVHYVDVLDPRLSPPASQKIIDYLDVIMKLAISCLCINPHSRPNMLIVCRTLEI